MTDRNAILREMTALRRNDFVRYRAEILDNVRRWHDIVVRDPIFGTMWGMRVVVTASSGRPTSADALRAVCERAMPPCFAWRVIERGDRAFLRITSCDATKSPVPPYYQPRAYRRGSPVDRHRRLWT